MTAPSTIPAPGSRRWIDDPNGPRPTPARKPPRRKITLVPRSEEPPPPHARPPASREAAAPRDAVPRVRRAS